MTLPKSLPLALLCALPLLFSCAHNPAGVAPSPSTETLAFGSCLRQWKPQPVWRAVNALSPNYFVFLGDNVYADVGKYADMPEPERIGRAYDDLAATPEYRSFLTAAKNAGTGIYATWDDHDYGANDGGGDYPYKNASKKYFQGFFDTSKSAAGGVNDPGVYQSQRLKISGLDVQLLLLDTRSFRSPLKKDPAGEACSPTHTIPDNDPQATILGDRQWRWLEQQLAEPADLRILASSIQVIPLQHCFEKWGNFPLERKRLFRLIRDSKAAGVVIISGDRHMAEISRLPASEVGYPLYEITSSGLNSAMGASGALFAEQNSYRLDDRLFDNNFGAISVENSGGEQTLALKIYRDDGSLAREEKTPLSTLRFK